MTEEHAAVATLPAVPPGAQVSFYDLLPEELEAWLVTEGQPAFRAKQLFAGVYGRLATTASAIAGVPKTFGAVVDDALPLGILGEVTRLTSADGRTTKLLFRTGDGCLIEGVLMHYRERSTACISSQAGCGYGCTFCATGKMGLTRNLSAGEIVAQVIALARLSEEQGKPLSNIVYMGMGEPLANYDQVMRSIAILNEPQCLKFGARRITVSTVGLAPRIRRLAEEPWQVNLAVSLHQTTDEARSALMPINRHYPIAEVMSAVRYYTAKTHRRVSFEYALMAGVNDTDTVANELATLLRGMLCHVNLIPLNPIADAVGPDGIPLTRPSQERAEAFAAMLVARGVPASVRYSRGTDIAAGCGQLRAATETAHATEAA